MPAQEWFRGRIGFEFTTPHVFKEIAGELAVLKRAVSADATAAVDRMVQGLLGLGGAAQESGLSLGALRNSLAQFTGAAISGMTPLLDIMEGVVSWQEAVGTLNAEERQFINTLSDFGAQVAYADDQLRRIAVHFARMSDATPVLIPTLRDLAKSLEQFALGSERPIPAVERLIDSLNALARSGDLIPPTLQRLQNQFKAAISGIFGAAIEVDKLGAGVLNLRDALGQLSPEQNKQIQDLERQYRLAGLAATNLDVLTRAFLADADAALEQARADAEVANGLREVSGAAEQSSNITKALVPALAQSAQRLRETAGASLEASPALSQLIASMEGLAQSGGILPTTLDKLRKSIQLALAEAFVGAIGYDALRQGVISYERAMEMADPAAQSLIAQLREEYQSAGIAAANLDALVQASLAEADAAIKAARAESERAAGLKEGAEVSEVARRAAEEAVRTEKTMADAVRKSAEQIRAERYEMSHALYSWRKYASAAQGVMMAVSTLRGNITSLLYSFMFMGLGVRKVTAAFYALTTAIIMPIKGLVTLTKAVVKFGRTAEQSLFRLRAFIGESEKAADAFESMRLYAIRFGFALEDVSKGYWELVKAGMMSNDLMRAAGAVARTTGTTHAEAAQLIVQAEQALTQEVRQLAAVRAGRKKATAVLEKESQALKLLYQMGVKGGEDLLKIEDRVTRARALESLILKQLGQNLKAYAETGSGAWEAIKESIKGALEALSTPIWQEVIVPVIRWFRDLAVSLYALAKAFWQSQQTQSFWAETLAMTRDILAEYGPELKAVANIIRMAFIAAMMGALVLVRLSVIAFGKLMSVVRGLFSAFKSLGTALKPVRDLLRMVFPKEMIVPVEMMWQNLKEAIGELWKPIREGWETFKEEVRKFFEENPVGIALATAWSFVSTVFESLWKFLKDWWREKFVPWWEKTAWPWFKEQPLEVQLLISALVPIFGGGVAAGIVSAVGEFVKKALLVGVKVGEVVLTGIKWIVGSTAGLVKAALYNFIWGAIGAGLVLGVVTLIIAAFLDKDTQEAWDKFIKGRLLPWIERHPVETAIGLTILGFGLRKMAPLALTLAGALTSAVGTAAASAASAVGGALSGLIGAIAAFFTSGPVLTVLGIAAAALLVGAIGWAVWNFVIPDEWKQRIGEAISNAFQVALQFVTQTVPAFFEDTVKPFFLETVPTFFTRTAPAWAMALIGSFLTTLSNLWTTVIVPFFTETVPNALASFPGILARLAVTSATNFVNFLGFVLTKGLPFLLGMVFGFAAQMAMRLTAAFLRFSEQVFSLLRELLINAPAFLLELLASFIQFVADLNEFLSTELPTMLLNLLLKFYEWEWDVADWLGGLLLDFMKWAAELEFSLAAKLTGMLLDLLLKFMKWENDVMEWLGGMLARILAAILAFIVELPGKIWEKIGEIGGALINFGVKLGEMVSSGVRQAWDNFLKGFGFGFGAKPVQEAEDTTTAIRRRFETLQDELVGHSILPEMAESVRATFSQLAGDVQSQLSRDLPTWYAEFAQFLSDIQEAFGAFRADFEKVQVPWWIDEVYRFLTGPKGFATWLDAFLTLLSDFGTTLADWVTTEWLAVSLPDFITRTRDFLTGPDGLAQWTSEFKAWLFTLARTDLPSWALDIRPDLEAVGSGMGESLFDAFAKAWRDALDDWDPFRGFDWPNPPTPPAPPTPPPPPPDDGGGGGGDGGGGGGGDGGYRCFIGDTLVWTYEEERETLQPKPIAEVQPGDVVFTMHGLHVVKFKWSRVRDDLLRIRVRAGEWSQELVCSPEHPFLTRWGWLEAEQLDVGMGLYGAQPAKVVEISQYEGEARVYDLTIPDDPTYRVGLFGLVVHNKVAETSPFVYAPSSLYSPAVRAQGPVPIQLHVEVTGGYLLDKSAARQLADVISDVLAAEFRRAGPATVTYR